MTTGRIGGGTGLGWEVETGGGLATGGLPPSNRRNSSSQSLVAAGGDSAGRQVVVPELRSDSASSLVASVLPGCFLLLSHSTMMEPMPIAIKIHSLSMTPKIAALVAPDIGRIMRKAGVIYSSVIHQLLASGRLPQLPVGFVCEPAPPALPPAPAMLSLMPVSA